MGNSAVNRHNRSLVFRLQQRLPVVEKISSEIRPTGCVFSFVLYGMTAVFGRRSDSMCIGAVAFPPNGWSVQTTNKHICRLRQPYVRGRKGDVPVYVLSFRKQ